MDKYTVKITPYAEGAAREIGQYIAVSLQSPQAAVHTLSAIHKEIRSLVTMPARFPLILEEPWHSECVHKMPVKNFLVYYWVDEKRKIVHIIHIVYAGRDQKVQLTQAELSE